MKTQNPILLMVFRIAALSLLRQVYAEATGRIAPFINGRVGAGMNVAGPQHRGRASGAVSGADAAILQWLARR